METNKQGTLIKKNDKGEDFIKITVYKNVAQTQGSHKKQLLEMQEF